ncbi:hypothetical protein H696_00686 [Fonticula alba]|uniref:Uncharacterized protein n=1 Tax=Fonticula alba TaxID=691883 RepID=A0A058ZGS6_FONAL|nr:hypothetical protein H696_00686 [Fonticula alba]KCV73138.1 hypothetical protein H696_00686 [Fonticula alba]|eukprot:XP_009492839.1 hypothetical protein H696_00686 [Fonticula alba]
MSPGWTGRRLPPLTTQRVRRRRISARHTRLLVAAEGLTERYGLLPDDIPPGFYGPGIFALDLVLSDGSGVIFRPEPALRHLLVLLQFPARPGEPHLAALARLLDALLVPEHLSQSLRDVSRRRHTLRALTSLPALPGILQELPSARESAPSGDTPFTRWPGLGRVTALSPDVDTFTIAAYGRLPVGLAGLGCGCPSEILLEVPVRVRVIPPGDNPFGGAAPQVRISCGRLCPLCGVFPADPEPISSSLTWGPSGGWGYRSSRGARRAWTARLPC